MERRDFLKGLGLLLAAPVVAKIPMALPKPEVAFSPKAGIASAWVHFDGRAPAIKDSFNVSSITQMGEGEYVVAFEEPMPINDYVVSANPMARTDHQNNQGFSVETFSGKNEDMSIAVFGSK
tara:strand:+ start:203 stop:568 length:366 start_codon:yes stop_codon:yes gene_type:complete